MRLVTDPTWYSALYVYVPEVHDGVPLHPESNIPVDMQEGLRKVCLQKASDKTSKHDRAVYCCLFKLDPSTIPETRRTILPELPLDLVSPGQVFNSAPLPATIHGRHRIAQSFRSCSVLKVGMV
jgi:hypothetical protein